MLGVRGRWLAAYRSDWQRVVDGGPHEDNCHGGSRCWRTPTGAAPQPRGLANGGCTAGCDRPETWRTGSRAERHAYLAALRERDPEAGRALLAADWARLPADERAALLAVLAGGLSADDEEFLDGVLDDRAAGVRVIAQRLLTRLPGSRFGQRATDRAAAVIRLERHGRRQSLAVTRPANPDAAAVRDGIDGRPPSPSIGVGRVAAHPVDRRRPARLLDRSARPFARRDRGASGAAGPRRRAPDGRARRLAAGGRQPGQRAVGRGSARGR